MKDLHEEEFQTTKPQKRYGEGTVFQAAPNKWTAKISLGHTPDGKPLYHYAHAYLLILNTGMRRAISQAVIASKSSTASKPPAGIAQYP